jgi:hypothetical protein
VSTLEEEILRSVEGILRLRSLPMHASLIRLAEGGILVELESLDAAEVPWEEIRSVSVAVQEIEGVGGVVLTLGRRVRR